MQATASHTWSIDPHNGGLGADGEGNHGDEGRGTHGCSLYCRFFFLWLARYASDLEPLIPQGEKIGGSDMCSYCVT